jgi:hypothetical protein
MAITTEGRQLTERFRQQQLAIRGKTGRDIAKAWKAFDPRSIRSYGDFVALATLIVNERHNESSELGTAYYNLFRQAEGFGGVLQTIAALPLDPDNIIGSLRATGLATALSALFKGESVGAASLKGLVAASGSASRLALNGGRDAVMLTMGNDRAARGWARVTSGSPCSFCAMLASRGPTFESRRTANFRAHDWCVCQPEPHYEGSAWPGKGREFERIWKDATRVALERGEDTTVVFRRRIEGRPDPPLNEE